MSKVFFDKVVALEKVDKAIKKVATSHEEKMELWQIIDEIVHHKLMGCILDKLPAKNHQEFLEKFHKAPHDESLLIYLTKNIKEDAEVFLKYEIVKIEYEILEWLGYRTGK